METIREELLDLWFGDAEDDAETAAKQAELWWGQSAETDEMLGAREIVVKTLGPQFASVPGIAGATILGDGSIVIILDVGALVRVELPYRVSGETD